MVMTGGKMTAELDAIRRRVGNVRDGGVLLTDTVAKDDAPRLMAALDGVLKLHEPRQLYQMVTGAPAAPACHHDATYDGLAHFEGDHGLTYCADTPTVQVCSSCADGPDGDTWADWPCATYKAITRVLLGEKT